MQTRTHKEGESEGEGERGRGREMEREREREREGERGREGGRGREGDIHTQDAHTHTHREQSNLHKHSHTALERMRPGPIPRYRLRLVDIGKDQEIRSPDVDPKYEGFLSVGHPRQGPIKAIKGILKVQVHWWRVLGGSKPEPRAPKALVCQTFNLPIPERQSETRLSC